MAGAVRRLPKPTTAAWLANTLVRVAAPAVDDLVTLGHELAHAQSEGLRAEVRRMVDRRRTLIGALVAVASDAADDAGQAFGTQVQRQLEETLEAAVADEAMAAALRSGRLSEPLRFVGFGGPADTPAPVSGAALSAPALAQEKRRQARLRSHAALEDARRAWRSAEAQVQTARQRGDAADERHRAALREERSAERERRAATAALDRAQQNLVEAKRKVDMLESARHRPVSEEGEDRGRR